MVSLHLLSLLLSVRKSRGDDMFMAIKKNKSLTFYQPKVVKSHCSISSFHVGGLSSVGVSSSVYTTTNTTTLFNRQLNGFLNTLNAEKAKIAIKVADGLANDPSYKGARTDGVKLAWKYEQADIEMGGRGSTDWNTEQLQEIKEKGKVRGAEGHHQKNVASHPEEQGNPDNIKFYKTQEEHKNIGHGGKFTNPTNGVLKDKDKMLRDTNRKRVFKNEVKGFTVAAAIGAGVGFLIGFAATLAQSGVTPDSFKYALIEGVKTGATAALQTIVGYGIGRTIGQVANNALQGILLNAGVVVTQNIEIMCSMAVFGMITISIFSVWQFYKLIVDGATIKEAAMRVGRQALFSITLLAVSIVAQGLWGGTAGLIVSTSIGIFVVANELINSRQQRLITENIKAYMIDKCKPNYT